MSIETHVALSTESTAQTTTKSAIRFLREEIAALVARSRELRREAEALRVARGASSGPERHALNEKRRALRPALRSHHLALAFLRGRPYGAVERHSALVADAESIAWCVTNAVLAVPGAPARGDAKTADTRKQRVAEVRAWLEARDRGANATVNTTANTTANTTSATEVAA
jgi:hypothetical protein